MSAKPVLVVGAAGQIARALARAGSAGNHPIVCRGRPETDMADASSLKAAFVSLSPAVVVNAAAYTAVDRAESEPQAAFAVNAEGSGHLARLCADFGVPLVHLSTDYVFDGTKTSPYTEEDAVAPLGVYGASKAAGEAAIRAAHPQHIILRTAWIYSTDGTNFFNTMMRLARERDELGVVDDQRGAPTYAADMADAIVRLVPQLVGRDAGVEWGTYHLTNGGQVTWCGFAGEIFRLAAARGLKTPRLKAITTAQYPTPARRPAYSVLDNGKIEAAFGIRLLDWRDALGRCLDYRMRVEAGEARP